MNVQESYDVWASRYDADENKTRDLEAFSLRQMLENRSFGTCLEIGCGTGKNTLWLSGVCRWVTAVDVSLKMLEKAREKVTSSNVSFEVADVTKPWDFTNRKYDLITFSLVLEHVVDLNPLMSDASRKLDDGGLVYIGELHPFKQYMGSKARFETKDGLHVIHCFTHHISDYIKAARQAGLAVEAFEEFFDDPAQGVPRIVSLLLKKN